MRDFHWTFGIWLTCLLYLFASAASWRLAEIVRRTIGNPGQRERTIWVMEGILLLALALSTATNGFGQLTTLFRAIAMDGGWYASRAPAQTHLIVLLLGAFVLAAVVSLYWARAVAPAALLVLLASLLLAAFVLVRAVSLHAVDRIVFARIAGVTVSSIVEAGGTGTILVLILWRAVMLRRPVNHIRSGSLPERKRAGLTLGEGGKQKTARRRSLRSD